MFFKRYGKTILRFIFTFAALAFAAVIAGFSAEGRAGLDYVNFALTGLLALNTALYARARVKRCGFFGRVGNLDEYARTRISGGESYAAYFFLNLSTAAAFRLIALNLVNFYTASGYSPAGFGLLPYSFIGAVAALFIYYAAAVPFAFFRAEDRGKLDAGYIKEAVLYLAFFGVFFVKSYIVSNFAFAFSGAVLLLLYARFFKSRANQITSLILVVLTAALFVLFFIGFHSLPGNFESIKIAFYALSFAAAVAWLVHSLFAYKFFGLGTAGGDGDGLKYIALSLIPVVMLVQCAFSDLDKVFASIGVFYGGVRETGEGYFFLNINGEASRALLYAVAGAAVLARLCIIAAALTVFKKPKKKKTDDGDKTDELGVSLSFEEALKERNIDLSDVPSSALEALGIPREELFSAQTESVKSDSAAVIHPVINPIQAEHGAPFIPPITERQKPVQAEHSTPFIPPITERQKPVQAEHSAPFIPPITERQKPVQAEHSTPFIPPITERQKPIKTEQNSDGGQPFDYANSLRISEALSDAGLKAAIDELVGRTREIPSDTGKTSAGKDAPSRDLYEELQTGSGIPLSVPYDIRQLNDRAAAPEDEESKKIDEILNRINGSD
ncbi:MAG: MFS transporter [Clostridiales bacterium]|jgi:hypothetical protein|nr:MFS transporter [Clostridiales bacterium]